MGGRYQKFSGQEVEFMVMKHPIGGSPGLGELSHQLDPVVPTLAPSCITLTDQWGHPRLICELPPQIKPQEISRLHHQILVHFQRELQRQSAARPLHLSWPQVVSMLEQRIGCLV